SPASITNTAETVASTGNAAAEVFAVLQSLCALFTNPNRQQIPLRESTLIMSERVCLAWAALVGSGGAPIFPDLKLSGGDIWGIDVETTAYSMPAQAMT